MSEVKYDKALVEQLEKVYATDIEPMIGAAESLVILTDQSYLEAGSIARELKKFSNFVENEIKRVTQPLVDGHKQALRAGEALTDPLGEAIDAVLEKMRTYREAHAKENEAKGWADDLPQIEGITRRVIYTFEIEDPKQVPEKYLIPDQKAIGEFVRSTKGGLKIPGVRIIAKESYAIKGA